MARVLILLSTLLVSFALSAQTRDLNKLYELAKFKIGKTELSAYVADDDQRRAQGLMFIEKLPADTGMLFVFERQEFLGFWMKNTLIPLAIGYFDKDGVLVDVQEMSVADSLMQASPPTYQSKSPALFALEMTKGWFDKKGIKPGSRLELISGTKSQLLKGKLAKAKKPRQ